MNNNGNITFVDYLIFNNFFDLWKIEYFIKDSIFNKLIELDEKKNIDELMEEFNYSNKKNNKKEKNNNHNNINNNNKRKKENVGCKCIIF